MRWGLIPFWWSKSLKDLRLLWDQWKNKETGERTKSCTMIISEPNDFVAEVHDRMPVLLPPEQFDRWLSNDMGVEELKPAPNDYLQRWPVSKRVNSSKADKDDSTLSEAETRFASGETHVRFCRRFRRMSGVLSGISCTAGLPAQVQGALDQTNVAVGLRKITQHAAGQGIELFRQ